MKKSFRFVLFCSIFIAVFSAFPSTAEGAGKGAENWFWSVQGKFLEIGVRIPADCYAYPEETMPELSPGAAPAAVPQSNRSRDPLLDEEISLYPGPGEYRWKYEWEKLSFPLRIRVKWQMCRRGKADNTPGTCLMPGSAELAFFADRKDLLSGKTGNISEDGEPEAAPESEENENPVLLASWRLLRRENGYLPPSPFLTFLQGEGSPSFFSFAGRSVFMMLLLALLGGLALNLTPCVLPLIPVNLAVIGAGAASGNSRTVRILRGLLYGAGIACTYGLLGVAAVVTGGTFGQLSSGWFFNLLAALVFLLLGLAMFDLFRFDLSGLQSRFRLPSAAGSGGIFLMGGLSAVLAGACVAPVVAAALLEASRLASSGNYAGLLLPFLVGVGMALPWPFAAAGLSLLPRPGGWMKHVKHVLGCLILLLALYCAAMAVSQLTARYDAEQNPGEESEKSSSFFPRINDALAESSQTGRPVLLYFGASWCKACRMMEAVTFRDPEVAKALEDKVIFVRIHAEQPDEPMTADLLRTFQVQGFPACLILKPEHL